MLQIARDKADKKKLDICFKLGDVRTVSAGKFDAVISIFNAIGHLTKHDFEKALRNINRNLKDRGIYIFDIFNLSYLLCGDNITNLTIDWQTQHGDVKVREIQYSTISNAGVLASYDIYHKQVGSHEPCIERAFQTLQVYSSQQLVDILHSNGFVVLKQCAIDGGQFQEDVTERILTVAQKY